MDTVKTVPMEHNGYKFKIGDRVYVSSKGKWGIVKSYNNARRWNQMEIVISIERHILSYRESKTRIAISRQKNVIRRAMDHEICPTDQVLHDGLKWFVSSSSRNLIWLQRTKPKYDSNDQYLEVIRKSAYIDEVVRINGTEDQA